MVEKFRLACLEKNREAISHAQDIGSPADGRGGSSQFVSGFPFIHPAIRMFAQFCMPRRGNVH